MFNIQGRAKLPATLRLYDLHQRCATLLLAVNVEQTGKRLNEMNCAGSCAGWSGNWSGRAERPKETAVLLDF